jgi:hypothetical protein
MLNEAKDELPHVEFIKMLEHDLRISPDKAEKLMAIARHPVLSNSAHVRFLPATYSTLYEMSRFPAATLLAKIESRKIHLDLQRSDVLVWGAEEIRRRFIESRKTVHEVEAPRVAPRRRRRPRRPLRKRPTSMNAATVFDNAAVMRLAQAWRADASFRRIR